MSRLGWLPFLFLECQEPKSADYMPPSLVAKTLRCRGGWWLCCRKEPLHKEREAARLRFDAGGCFVVGVWLFLVTKPGPATTMARGLPHPTPHLPLGPLIFWKRPAPRQPRTLGPLCLRKNL